MISIRLFPALALGLFPLLSGCIGTATKVVTAPVRVTGKAVDLATTSQSEADEKRGREIREREEKLAKLDRRYQKHLRECDEGDDEACLKARNDYADMQHYQTSY
ncbi:hypothetical protein [Novosphingobium mangrovi (ex Huang et al. 2023)]|uniref:Lipoprotein n=1 Tax=Novosphingobium mangrovi (ex Huang et al. 2023) TaxID=2976432 RepID=A0ABT2I8Z8_9SPHN|nr:hypothetical protein [Novosphingobium mangrovi (ex Huang et al. 2023)]MCT2401311.1 hypothetical protein [Novosphingobium mangrovi (ex Huang et al. 2023)]